MMSSKCALTTLTILAATALASEVVCAKDTSTERARQQSQQRQTTESFAIKGEHISQVFAAVCQENNFAEYHAWALKNHFMLRQFESPKYEIAENEIKDDELIFSVTINEQNNWQAKLRDQIFTGDDPCTLAMAYINSRAPKRISLLTLLVPEARAEKLVNEATTINWLLGALATASVTDGPFLDHISNKLTLPNSIMLSAAFRAANTASQKIAKSNFEKLLNQPIELTCSNNRVKISGKDMHILVKKGYTPYRLGFADNKTGKSLAAQNQILPKGRVHDYLVGLGQRCTQPNDAAAISAQLQAERDNLNMKIARASLLNRSISSDED